MEVCRQALHGLQVARRLFVDFCFDGRVFALHRRVAVPRGSAVRGNARATPCAGCGPRRRRLQPRFGGHRPPPEQSSTHTANRGGAPRSHRVPTSKPKKPGLFCRACAHLCDQCPVLQNVPFVNEVLGRLKTEEVHKERRQSST